MTGDGKRSYRYRGIMRSMTQVASPLEHPVLVWVHGGGWQGGSRAMGHAIELVQHGYALAAPQYRLSGEARFPAQMQDLKGAVRWQWWTISSCRTSSRTAHHRAMRRLTR